MDEFLVLPGKFYLGKLLSTRGVEATIAIEDVEKAIDRHLYGDWGDLDPADWEENELSLKEGFRLLSAYHDRNGVKFWIITEADRSVTTVLLPEEY